MIINCICGLKKFKVDDDEIPSEGRKLKCGACSQVWFYDPSNPDASVPLDEQQENQTQTPSPNIPEGDVPQNVEETISQAEQTEQQNDIESAPFVEESSDDIMLDEASSKPKMTIFSDDDLPSKSDMDDNLDKMKSERKKKGFFSSLFSKKDPLEKAKEAESKVKKTKNNIKVGKKKKEGGARTRLLIYFLIILLFALSVMLVPYRQHVTMAFPQLNFYFDIVAPYYKTLKNLLIK